MRSDMARGIRLGIGVYLGLYLFRLYSVLCGILMLALLPAVVLHAWGPVLALGLPTLILWVGGWCFLFGRGR